MPEATLDERLAKIEQTQSQIADVLTILAKSVPKKDTAESRKPVVFRKVEPDTELDPVPAKYRKLVDKLLGKDFELEMFDSAFGNVGVKIIVPERYDRRNGKSDAISKFDITAVVLRGSSPLADLENWCIKVIETIKKEKGLTEFIPKK
jgi:hypothetical protein